MYPPDFTDSPPPPGSNSSNPPGSTRVELTIRRICCSQCVGAGVVMMKLNKSLLDISTLPPQQVQCPQCLGSKFIEVVVPVPSHAPTKSPDSTKKIL